MSFLEVTDSINSWIISHKELVTLVVVPSLAWFVTSVTNRAAEKRALKNRIDAEKRSAAERRLQLELRRRTKLADFRQNWIDSLREDFSVILGAKPVAKDSNDQIVADYNIRIQRVLLRMNPAEGESVEVFNKLLEYISKNGGVDDEEIVLELANLMNLYLKTEWGRLKKELESYDEAPATP